MIVAQMTALYLLLVFGPSYLFTSAWADTVPQEGDIHLAGGTSANEGRVEVFHNRQWGTVCDNDWNITDANVVCRQLGYSRATSAPGEATFGEGIGPIHYDIVSCTGSEARLVDCDPRGVFIPSCGHHEDSGVVCEAGQSIAPPTGIPIPTTSTITETQTVTVTDTSTRMETSTHTETSTEMSIVTVTTTHTESVPSPTMNTSCAPNRLQTSSTSFGVGACVAVVLGVVLLVQLIACTVVWGLCLKRNKSKVIGEGTGASYSYVQATEALIVQSNAELHKAANVSGPNGCAMKSILSQGRSGNIAEFGPANGPLYEPVGLEASSDEDVEWQPCPAYDAMPDYVPKYL